MELMYRNLLIFLTCLVAMSGLRAQSDTDVQPWIDISDQFALGDNWTLGGDAGFRISTDTGSKLVLVRPRTTYRLGQVTLLGGVGFFYLWDSLSGWEFRPWQGIQIKWPSISALRFTHFFRSEERFLRINSIEFLKIFRLRYRLTAQVPLNNEGSLYLPMYLEAFMNAAGDIPASFLNRTRATLGLGKVISKDWRLELQYIIQQGRDDASEEFRIREHVFRLKLIG